uniref:ShKT domain-containing protein n=1 Tax=Globodera pallida TaxID=36090 RepID=A0A183BW73_GLOPA
MVSIPYWDSSLDQRLPNPADSIMWSANFMGAPDGRGGIADGFLADWITMSGTPIQRRLGEDGELITEEEINSMINQRLMDNVFAFPSRQNNGGCRRPNPDPEDVVELNHNNVHTWIGGDMGGLPTAPQDPVFFMHHCFIDYIWEQWRLKWQSRTQRETEFPTDREVDACSGSVNYRLSATMRPFQDPVVLNRVGLSNDYTDFLYTYAPRPTCQSAGGCGSPYLFCDTTKRTPLCCAKIKPGGDCSTFRGNREQPCYASTCGRNGRCSGGPRVARRSPDGSSSESYNRTNVGHGASSGEGRYGYGGGGYGGKTSPTTTTPSTYTTTPAEEYTTPSPTPAPPKERVCYDNHECCAQWAAKDACKTAPRYMNTWCPGSCNYDGCQPQPQQQRSAGKDRYMQCKRWSKFHEHYGRAEGWRTYRPNKVLKREKLRNECERNPHWMACNCPEACSSVKRKNGRVHQTLPKRLLAGTA